MYFISKYYLLDHLEFSITPGSKKISTHKHKCMQEKISLALVKINRALNWDLYEALRMLMWFYATRGIHASGTACWIDT